MTTFHEFCVNELQIHSALAPWAVDHTWQFQQKRIDELEAKLNNNGWISVDEMPATEMHVCTHYAFVREESRPVLVKLKFDDCPIVCVYTETTAARGTAKEWKAVVEHLYCDTGNYGNGGSVEQNFTGADVECWKPITLPPAPEQPK